MEVGMVRVHQGCRKQPLIDQAKCTCIMIRSYVSYLDIVPYVGNIWRGKILVNTHFLNRWMVNIGELTFASYLDGKTETFGG